MRFPCLWTDFTHNNEQCIYPCFLISPQVNFAEQILSPGEIRQMDDIYPGKIHLMRLGFHWGNLVKWLFRHLNPESDQWDIVSSKIWEWGFFFSLGFYGMGAVVSEQYSYSAWRSKGYKLIFSVSIFLTFLEIYLQFLWNIEKNHAVILPFSKLSVTVTGAFPRKWLNA